MGKKVSRKNNAKKSSTGKLLEQAREELKKSIVTYRGEPVGTVAARDTEVDSLNYDQVFTRDFAVSAVAFLLEGQPDVVRGYLETTLELQSRDRHMDCFRPGPGLMPASFKVEKEGDVESIIPDFGEKAIARVAPVDAPMWWLYILRMYTRATGDDELARRKEFHRGIRLILDLLLTSRFDMFPTLLVPDGSFMVDRRMGVYGHPVDIQALFFTALRSAQELLKDNAENRGYIEAAQERLGHLLYHIRRYYWLDRKGLNNLYRGGVEAYGQSVRNPFNIHSDSIPLWLMDWLGESGGYFAGNLGPARIDCRWFAAGNLMAVLSSLADKNQGLGVLELIERRWEDLIGEMPVKVLFPALEEEAWQLYTGSDPKNTSWSYQNAAGWPFLLWMFSAAAVKLGRVELAERALEVAERRLADDRWPEYYDGRHSSLVGKESRLFQTWSIAGYLAAVRIVQEPKLIEVLGFEEDEQVIACSLRAPQAYSGSA